MGYSVFNQMSVPEPPRGSEAPDISNVKAEPLVEPLMALLTTPGIVPSFPLGTMLPTPADGSRLVLDAGVASVEQRALVCLGTLVSLPEVDPNETREDGAPKELREGPVAMLIRQCFADWLTWQDPQQPEVAQLLEADLRHGLVAYVKALEEVASLDTDPAMPQHAWAQYAPGETQQTSEEKLLSLQEKILLSFRNDTYHRSIAKGKTVPTDAARKDAGAYAQALLDAPVGADGLALRDAVPPTALTKAGLALAQPFGGRTLLAALYAKLVFNHLGLVVSSTGKPTPTNALVHERALWVLNAAAATPGHPLAGSAATVAAAYRKLRLGADGRATELLSLLPKGLRAGLPVCFQRSLLHAPQATRDLAQAVFEAQPNGTGKAWAALVDPVAALARLTASLLLDLPSASALNLNAPEFAALAMRAESLKRGGKKACLDKLAPDAQFRVQRLLPQLERHHRYHSWMARIGADTLAIVRVDLQHRLGWPAVPALHLSGDPMRGEYPPPKR